MLGYQLVCKLNYDIKGKTQAVAMSLVGGDESKLHFPMEQVVDELKRESESTLVNLHVGSKQSWNYGEMEFEAEMRRFDRSVN